MTETDTLLAYLDAARRHVVGILDGLDDAAWHRPVLPSGWSCAGLVNHLTVDDERFWFAAVVAAEPEAVAEMSGPPTRAWQVAPDVRGADLLARYRAQAERSDAAVRAASLDAAPAWWPGDQFGDFRLDDVREVVLHVLLETATHAGHLDAARELIDGRQWIVLPD